MEPLRAILFRDAVHPTVRGQGVRQNPRRSEAVSFAGKALAIRQLNAKANQLAHLLIRCTVPRGVSVGLCLNRSLDLLVSLLAIQKSGAAYVPLDPGFPAERLAYMLQDSGAYLLLTGRQRGRWYSRGPDQITLLKLDTGRHLTACPPMILRLHPGGRTIPRT